MRRFRLKLNLFLCIMLMAVVFSGYTTYIDKEFDFGEVDNKQYIYDYAGEYSDSEEQKLQKKCEELKEELGLDIILVTTNDLGYNDPYASDSTIEYYEMDELQYLIDNDNTR